MTLTAQQMTATENELQENFQRAGLTVAQVTEELGISTVKLGHIMHLTQRSYEDIWIMRNYLLKKVAENGATPVPFTALNGDWHRHWFLNSALIDAGKMTAGDF
ncbi:DUF2316 family protein [Furfurilactobacillus entadae]|uniref:DUF2316 family protein n=1 Tax=Furfurilactobacillus entadae TaxID=2922307 RepID=UPI0035EBC7E9